MVDGNAMVGRVLAGGSSAASRLSLLRLKRGCRSCRRVELSCMPAMPAQFEAGFTSLAHTDADIDATIAAAKRAFKRI
jgi:hypothetical protein